MKLISRRTLATGLAGLAAPAIVSRPARAQIKKGDELVVGVWGGDQERLVRQFCAKPLEEKYGVKISLVLGGTTDRRSRAYAERGRPSFDLIYLNIFESRQAVKDGVTQPASRSVPNYANLYDIAKLGGYGVALIPITICYDKRRAAPITSWKDLWRPELRGKLAWPSYPGAEGTAGLVMAARSWGGSEKDIDFGFKKIAELKPFAAINTSQDQLFAMFDGSLCDAGIEIAGYMQAYANKNPNVVLADPVEGRPLAMNVACITVGTKNQALAEEWVDLHLSPACQEAYARTIFYGPTTKNTVLQPELAKRVVYGEADVGRLLDFDWDLVSRSQQAWSSRFAREIAG
jgi:putative spermidine/putrescine transport system substrate-binding protein